MGVKPSRTLNVRCTEVLEKQHLYKNVMLSKWSMFPQKELFEIMRLT